MKVNNLINNKHRLSQDNVVRIIFDIVMRDVGSITDFDESIQYKKGDKVYVYDNVTDTHRILICNTDNPKIGILSNLEWDDYITSNSINPSDLEAIIVNDTVEFTAGADGITEIPIEHSAIIVKNAVQNAKVQEMLDSNNTDEALSFLDYEEQIFTAPGNVNTFRISEYNAGTFVQLTHSVTGRIDTSEYSIDSLGNVTLSDTMSKGQKIIIDKFTNKRVAGGSISKYAKYRITHSMRDRLRYGEDYTISNNTIKLTFPMKKGEYLFIDIYDYNIK